ncbi:MAG: 4Fe-4S binding protein [Dehalococcoidales bacterium]|nr:4Fe-4S binding protein [Dehalococcoidales bacterium]
MTEQTDVYARLGEMVGAPGSERFVRILEAMVTPDEARLMLEMPEMIDCGQIAEKLKMAPEELQAKLDDMAERGLIMKRKTGYAAPRSIVFFHHGAIGYIKEELRPQINPLWSDFYYNEWADMLAEEYIKRHDSGALPAHRVAPAHKALLMSPNITPDQILWYEDIEQVLRRSIKTNLLMCGCRGMWRKCDKPVFVCLHVQFPWAPVIPGMRLRPIRGKPPRDLTAEAALKVVHSCEDRGQVHIPLNIAQADLYCNCCDDCCVVIHPLNKHGRVHDVLSPSRFRAVVNPDLCSGCQTCLERCYFSAIEMKKAPGSKKLKSSVINEHCMGCGSCVVGCPQKAIRLELVRPPSHIPNISAFELLSGKKTPGEGTPG